MPSPSFIVSAFSDAGLFLEEIAAEPGDAQAWRCPMANIEIIDCGLAGLALVDASTDCGESIGEEPMGLREAIVIAAERAAAIEATS